MGNLFFFLGEHEMTLIAKNEYQMILIAKRFKTYVFLFLWVFEPFLREVVLFLGEQVCPYG
jgi:hypothetical protein